MAEQAQNGPQDKAAPQPPPAQPAPAPPYAEDALLHPGVPTDDQPTIITRKSPLAVTSEDTLASVLRGKRLAHYELLAPIGVGGMAAVIRARDTQLDRTVALKILPPDMAADSENVQRFHQEARAAAKLDHENIARAFFCGEDQGLHFIAFEYVEGENLRTLLEKRGRLPVAEALHYLLQIATGLAHAADRGVVHRDIKPSNIIISPNGRAKLVDMGLARSLHHDNGLTQSGVTLGTFDYISPEQAMEPRDADARSDIYSLGCTAYHMLTGQPPVPEGTAAKKLHHHQHIDPLDPRALNPHMPDEVAALLSRMMAKDPKQRYQQPDELVQHLLHLAQKYGAATQPSDGVLFVEAPVPAPPRSRPLVLSAIAVAALLLLIAVLGQTTPWPAERRDRNMDRSGTDDRNAKTENTGTKNEDRDKGEPREPAQPPVEPQHDLRTPPLMLTARTVRELADILEKQPHAVVQIGDDLNLRSLDETLTITGGDVTLQAEAGKRPTIRLKYDGNPGGDLWAALTIKAGRVKLIGLRFEVDATEAPELVMTAIALQGGHLTVKKCEFEQLHPPPDPRLGSLSSVSILPLPRGEERGPRTGKSRLVGPTSSGEGEKPPLILEECVFAGGQRALTSTVPATINFINCGVGPYSGAVFHVQGTNSVNLRLLNCAVLVGDAPVFRLQDGATGVLIVSETIFAGVRGPASAGGMPALGMREDMDPAVSPSVLIQQTGTSSGLVRYDGQANAYYNLKAYWQLPQGPDITKYADFRQRIARDEKSHELTTAPWQDADPVALLRRNEPRLAFQVNANLRELRAGSDGTRAIGVQRGPWGTYEPLPRLEEPKPAEAVVRREKIIVDPSGMEAGSFRTLNGAIGEAKPGDVILIKHNGRLPVDAVRLEKANLDLTVRPHPDFRPVLTLGDATDGDAALFRLHDGKLRLENLHFALSPPPREGFRSQTVVAMLGDGQCTFKDCVATLEETDAVQMSLITLVDPSTVMRMGSSPRLQGPSLRVESCFIRGAGDLVTVRPSRPFELQLEESLVSLEGSLLVVEGAAREPPPTSVGQIQLKKVTAYLRDHLVRLKAARDEGRMGRGLVPTWVSLQNNLLYAANTKSMIHLDGVDTDEQMKRLFVWNGGQHNAYSNFTQMLDQQPREQDQMAPSPYDKARWERFTNESDARYERVKFASPPAEGQHTRATPKDFKVKAEVGLQGCGADLDHLPQPADDAPSE